MTGHHKQINVQLLGKAQHDSNSIAPQYFGLNWHPLSTTLNGGLL